MKPRLYTIWHLNLMYSSIEIERRAQVIEKCFWPLIELAKKGFKPGIEAPALTLEIAQQLDPAWVQELKSCYQKGLLEFVGSGYSQLIGPLVPAKINQANIRAGKKSYQDILGKIPSLWMANEQSFSRGLAECLIDEKIENLVVDWSNPFSLNPQWDENLVFSAQRTTDTQGRQLNVIWSESLAFQKFQRYIHQENVAQEYTDFLKDLLARMQSHGQGSSFCIYGNDAEIFDFRPGRFATEPTLEQSQEWPRIFKIMESMQTMGFDFIHPSSALQSSIKPQVLSLTALHDPNSVKKQPKYNVTRWALTGRNSPWLNQNCFDLLKTSISDQKICELWSSDYRTHITEKRWNALNQEIKNLTASLPLKKPSLSQNMDPAKPLAKLPIDEKIFIETKDLKACLNPLRGMSLESVSLKNQNSILGRIRQGTLSRIDLSADWFSGNVVLELPGKAQMTDLKKCTVMKTETEQASAYQTRIAFSDGHVTKTLAFPKLGSEWQQEYLFEIPELPVGSLRFGFLTLFQPKSDAKQSLSIKTHLGGQTPEIFNVPDFDFDHGLAASSLVSARQCLGMTEDEIEILTDDLKLKIKLEASSLRPLAMVENKMSREGRFFRLYFSLSEYDDTRRGAFPFMNQFVRFKYQLEKR